VTAVPSENPIDTTLRLARDLCLGVGAFFVTPAGTVFSSLSDVMRPEDAERRVAALARSCLSHPSARGKGLLWSAEPADEGDDTHPDSSLACVVAPVWSGETWLGLLGVVDVWLPELDAEQRAGLLALAADLPGQGAHDAGTAAAGDAIPAASALSEPARGAAPDGTPVGTRGPGRSPEPFLGEVLDNLPDGLVVTRADGTIVLVNHTFSTMTGLDMDSVLGEDVAAVLEPLAAPGEEGGWAETPEHGRSGSLERALATPEPGTRLVVPNATDGEVAFDAAGRRIESRFAGDAFVTLMRTVEERSERLGGGIQDLLDHIEDGIVCCDAAGTVLVANRAARRLQGLDAEQLQVGDEFPATTGLRTGEGEAVGSENHPLVRSMREGAPITEDLILETPDGLVQVAISARPLRVDGGEGAIAVLRDVTAERERQEHLTHYALHDPLTGVANRYLLNDALGRMLDGLVRRGGSVSLIYVDLDDFKAINDAHGHDTGDEVLRALARRLERAVRGEDVVARLGGDEFVVAHVTADRLSDGDTVVARVRKVLSAPYRFGDLALDVRASVGWVSTSSGGDSPESIISRADRAMYERKRARHAPVEGVGA
jgi:diguanylate cyclase (GGDEF)-like protein/PAS domain S-box-containing protein